MALGVLVLLTASALLAASETALFALVRMEPMRDRLSGHVRSAFDRLMKRPVESLVVIIGLNEASNVFAECLATSFFLVLFGHLGPYVAIPVMFVLVLFFAEITPKTFALGFPHWVAWLTARPLAGVAAFAHPVARWFAPLSEAPSLEPVSESEFKALLQVSENRGEVEAEERKLIHRVFDLANRRVVDVMTPRESVFALDLDTPPDRLNAEVAAGHFSRVPVYRGDPENIIGILHVKDLVMRRLDPVPPRLGRLVRPPYFIPPRKPVAELLDAMRRDRVQLAIVVNEFGRLIGLVSVEDLLEELVGEIGDEFDVEGPEISRTGSREWLVSGGIEIRRLSEVLGPDALPAVDNPGQSLSHFLLRWLGRIPSRNEKFKLGTLEAEVEKVRGANIELLRLRR